MKFCFLGAYDPYYQRNAIIKKGLAALGDEISEFTAEPEFKAWLRYPLLLSRLALACSRFGSRVPLKRMDYFFVPEFCQKDVPLARLLAAAAGKPLVFDPLAARYETKILDRKRLPPSSLKAWWNFRIDGWSFRLSDIVLADTSAHRDYYNRRYSVPSEKIGVVPIGYDDAIFDPERFPAPPPGPEFIILFVGSFLPLHGVDSIVEAAGLIRRSDPSILFRLIGSGQTLGRAKILASEIGATNCRFEPWVSLRDLPAIIASADVCLGIFGRTGKARRVVPHKIYQSLGMRKPVITARTPAVEEFFIDGEDVILCEEPYPESLAAAIIDLKKNPGRGERIARNAYRLVRKRYTPTAIASQLKDVLRKFQYAGKI